MKEIENNVQRFWRLVKEGKAHVLKENEPWPDYKYNDSPEELCKLTIEYNIGGPRIWINKKKLDPAKSGTPGN